jgi:hypothetical protein
MGTLFKASSNFASLSLRDLVEARDLFHFHLLNKKNVVATAVGLYRIRKDDPWPGRDEPNPPHARRHDVGRRTLFNSEVRPYSWPCVYVFVSDWEQENSLADTDPTDVVPQALYLPDGRSVPVCVIEAREQPWSKDLRVQPVASRNLLGPGSAIVNRDGQGMDRIGTVGCIVRDGERYYALTNRHVVGEAGTAIEALQVHRTPHIGVAAEKGLTRRDFKDVYPSFPSTRQHLLMDVGLVDLDDMTQWKTEVPGISPMGPVVDLYDNSLSLRLITMKVAGRSAISGIIRGEIHGLFYRYKAMGGAEYVADLLIGPETWGSHIDHRIEQGESNKAFGVHHGDSGTLLFLEHVEPDAEGRGPHPRKADHGTKTYLPLALLWGREEIFTDNRLASRPYALATSLSTALDLLDLDYVEDINRDQTYVWGWVGHYEIGRSLALATDVLSSEKLRAFIGKNRDSLSLEPDDALDNDPRVQHSPSDDPAFVPLADVPDNVWKSNVNFTMVTGADGRKHHQTGPGSRGQDDNANHFADLDLPYEGSKTFLELNGEDPDTYLNPKAWVAYFAAMKEQHFAAWDKAMGSRPGNHWGALPFRVHQLFDTMVAAAKAGDQNLFLVAGGALIHYVGDACQPLHASYLSQGDPDRVTTRPKSGKPVLEADGVHSGYEDTMIAYGYQKANLDVKLKARMVALGQDPGEVIGSIGSGYGASKAIIDLITKTQTDITPRSIIDKWVELKGAEGKPAKMWAAFGDMTVKVMARGTRYLASIWQAAWDLGDGDANIGSGNVAEQKDLMKLYNDASVVPSIPLDRYPDDPHSDWSVISALTVARGNGVDGNDTG